VSDRRYEVSKVESEKTATMIVTSALNQCTGDVMRIVS